jgi:hypothetical protein
MKVEFKNLSVHILKLSEKLKKKEYKIIVINDSADRWAHGFANYKSNKTNKH